MQWLKVYLMDLFTKKYTARKMQIFEEQYMFTILTSFRIILIIIKIIIIIRILIIL